VRELETWSNEFWPEVFEKRDKWDQRFLDMASLIKTWSKDPNTQTGAVIVRPNRSIASVGFNGFPRNMRDDEELYADRPKKLSRIVHCEMNALLAAVEPVRGYMLYTTTMCCDRCVVHMLQAGISRFVWPEDTKGMMSRWAESFALTQSYLDEAGVSYREVSR